MKGKPKEKPSAIFNAHDEYLIIGYSNHDDSSGKYTEYFILDDNFYINTITKDFFLIIPEKDASFIKVYDDEYVSVFSRS
jgi:hypothetical protein